MDIEITYKNYLGEIRKEKIDSETEELLLNGLEIEEIRYTVTNCF